MNYLSLRLRHIIAWFIKLNWSFDEICSSQDQPNMQHSELIDDGYLPMSSKIFRFNLGINSFPMIFNEKYGIDEKPLDLLIIK